MYYFIQNTVSFYTYQIIQINVSNITYQNIHVAINTRIKCYINIMYQISHVSKVT